MMMKALVWYGPNDLRYEDWPVPELAEDEILLKVAYSGICGSEMSIIHGVNTHGAIPPKVLGHEFSGTIAAKGEAMTQYQIGERVTAHPHAGCGECYYCKRAQEGFCLNPFNFLTSKDSGAFAEYTKVKAKTLYRIPDWMSFKTASLIEPISIAVHAASLIKFQPGDTVVILGGGTIGLTCLLIMKHYGAGTVILSDPVAKRREAAAQFGADITVDPMKEDLLEVIKRNSEGYGFDLCVEAAGNEKTCGQAISLVKKGGTVLVVGVAPPDKYTPISFCDVNKREIKIIGSNWSPYSFDRTISMMKNFDPDPIITHEFKLPEFKKALESQEDKSALKTTFVLG
jgi:threonine dehydrogenase-like Zn-dependent dehydrogenase